MAKAPAPPNKRLAGWFKKLTSSDEIWQPRGEPYPRLLASDVPAASLQGACGVYAIWHLGVRPQWLRVRASQDMASAIAAAKLAPAILAFQPNGGLYVTWMTAAPERARGLAASLIAELRPVRQEPLFAGDLDIPKTTPVLACQPPPGSAQPAALSAR